MTKAVLIDLSGVVYQGASAVPGARDAIARLRRAGIPIRFLTNTTRSTKAEILKKLDQLNIACSDQELLTPAYAACTWMRRHDRSAHLLVHPNLTSEFDQCPAHRPPVVVIGDAGETFTYATLNSAFRALDDGAELLTLANNRYFRDEDGQLSLDAGPFVKALEFASGKTAIILGKPSRGFFESALADVGVRLEDAVMIGDDAESDVSGALEAGIGKAILVRTGKYMPKDESRVTPPPTSVVDDITAAVDWILA